MTQESLVKKLRKKDEEAFIYIMNKYSKLLWKIADDILKNVCSAEDIEECISDIYFKLWQNPEAFDSQKSNIKNYLVMMTKCNAIDIYRKKAKKNELELCDNAVDYKNDPVNSLICKERRNELNNALNSLSAGDKEIIARRYFQDEKSSEISRKMELPLRNVENRLYRAKQSLRKILGSRN